MKHGVASAVKKSQNPGEGQASQRRYDEGPQGYAGQRWETR